MKIRDYSFKIGDLAIIHQGKVKDLNLDLFTDYVGLTNLEMNLETNDTTLDGEPILVEENDLILLPKAMMPVTIAPKQAIGKPFQLPGFLIKMPASIVMSYGVNYIRYKLTIEMHRLLLETHRFAFQTVITLDQISKLKLLFIDEEAKLVNANALIYMNQLVEATAKAVFAHKRTIERWKTEIKVIKLSDKHWN